MNKSISRRSFLIGASSVFIGAGAVYCFRKQIALADTHIIKNAKYIWPQGNPPADLDIYTEFKDKFKLVEYSNVVMEIACDSMYTLWINEKIAGFAQCSDWPDYKYYDRIDITNFCEKGDNSIRIQVWYRPGSGCSNYAKGTAGLIFQVADEDNILCYSSQNTKSRFMNEYWAGRASSITPQIGFDFWYGLDALPNIFNNSKVVLDSIKLHEREIPNLKLLDQKQGILVREQDTFKPKIHEFETAGSILFDFKCETVGFLDIKFKNTVSQKIHICWGEHICDKDEASGVHHVRWVIGNRDFSVHLQSKGSNDKNKKAVNQYMNTFRRLGCRYIEVFYEKEKPEIEYVTLYPVVYPVDLINYKILDTELLLIYNVSVKTLECSMHEHYEDCPWREQSLYGMDGRNQMLCGYYAFEGHNYQRHNLILLSKSLREKGILEICSPCETDYPIPFFSLCYILAIYEYLVYTKDKSILKIIENSVDTILTTFSKRVDLNLGLIRIFDESPVYWNFYEWAAFSDGNDHQPFHLMLNIFYVYVHDLWNKITGKTYLDTNKLRERIKKYFYDEERDRFVLFPMEDPNATGESQLGIASMLLAGINDKELENKLALKLQKDLAASRTETGGQMVKATLSMKTFVYDALIKHGYKEEVLKDIKYCNLKMINDPVFTGTFWETEEGQSAFGNAGSLCHGWSAIPAYYIPKYFI